jgi:hypothetical protein
MFLHTVSGHTAANVKKENIFIFFEREKDLEREERIQISHSTQGSRSRAE